MGCHVIGILSFATHLWANRTLEHLLKNIFRSGRFFDLFLCDTKHSLTMQDNAADVTDVGCERIKEKLEMFRNYGLIFYQFNRSNIAFLSFHTFPSKKRPHDVFSNWVNRLEKWSGRARDGRMVIIDILRTSSPTESSRSIGAGRELKEWKKGVVPRKDEKLFGHHSFKYLQMIDGISINDWFSTSFLAFLCFFTIFCLLTITNIINRYMIKFDKWVTTLEMYKFIPITDLLAYLLTYLFSSSPQ